MMNILCKSSLSLMMMITLSLVYMYICKAAAAAQNELLKLVLPNCVGRVGRQVKISNRHNHI
jgi:hypothetical protein